jgi:hypothetical protein
MAMACMGHDNGQRDLPKMAAGPQLSGIRYQNLKKNQFHRFFKDHGPLMSDDVTGSSREVDVVDQESVDIDVVLVSSTSETESPNTNPKAKVSKFSLNIFMSALNNIKMLLTAACAETVVSNHSYSSKTVWFFSFNSEFIHLLTH